MANNGNNKIWQHNAIFWDQEALAQRTWSKPVSTEVINAAVFGHSLTDQINGQLDAGFALTGFYEDEHPTPRFLIEKFIPTMLATKALKTE